MLRADLDDDEDGSDEDEDGRGKQSRSEKKSRKAMQKLGMKPVPGIIRCTVKKSKNVRRARPLACGGPAPLLPHTAVAAAGARGLRPRKEGDAGVF